VCGEEEKCAEVIAALVKPEGFGQVETWRKDFAGG
jgi:hypothetical protein